MNNLSILRKRKKLRQKDVAEAMHVSQNVMSNYENGQREPPLDLLIRLADFFDVSVDYLIGHESGEASVSEVQTIFDQLNDYHQAQSLGFMRGLLLSEGKTAELPVTVSVFPQKVKKNEQSTGG